MERYLTEKGQRRKWWELPSAIASGVMSAIGIKVLATDFYKPGDDLLVCILAAVVFMGLLAAPLLCHIRRARRRKQARAMAGAFAECGQSSLTYGALERRTKIGGARYKLRKLIDKGFLKNVEPDDAKGMARLSGVEWVDSTQVASGPVMDTGNAEFNETLQKIRDLNDRIKDRNVSKKIDRIEELTGGIFKLITEHPDKASDARRFVQYYLPTTMKLLESYDLLEEQRYQGENIQASRRQIEGVLDTLIRGVERQQDRMFRADALDVEAEISVLETMLAADGLTGPEHGLRLRGQ